MVSVRYVVRSEHARSSRPHEVEVEYEARPDLEAWVLHEGTVAESVPHDAAAQRLRLVLDAWAERSGRDVAVVRNLAMRWMQDAPQIGIDPDVAVLEPRPPDLDTLKSLRLWVPGHRAPRLCFEIVSESHPHKDYRDVHDRYTLLGAEELCVFDPALAGSRSMGGPLLLQLWRRRKDGKFKRAQCGNGPVYSEVLGAWLLADGGYLAIANDAGGAQRWLTREEQERAEKERERAARVELEARIAELEKKLEPGP